MDTGIRPGRDSGVGPVNTPGIFDGHLRLPLEVAVPGCDGLSVSEVQVDAAELFDRHAAAYRQTVESAVGYSRKDLAFFTAAKAHHLKSIAGRLATPLREAALLDVGCGLGGLDQLLAPHVGRLVGVDVSEGMLEAAQRLNPGVEYFRYSGGQLPFADQMFDLVFAVCVLHHVEPAQWAAFVGEMWRVTRTGGATVIIEHNPLNPLTRRSVAACDFDADAVLTSPRPVVRMLRRLGAKRAQSRYFLFTPFGGDTVQAVEARLLARLPLGAQYIVEAAR